MHNTTKDSISKIDEKVKDIPENFQIKLHIDTDKYNNKPDKTLVGLIKTRMQKNTLPVETTIPDLLNKICDGFSVTPAVMQGTEAKHWIQQQLFLIDIDNEADETLANDLKTDVKDLPEDKKTPLLPLDEALTICKINNIAVAFYYYSFRHTEAKPKYRLGFILNEIITDTNKRYAVMESLLSLFTQADKSCKNADRFFYGTNKTFKILDLKEFATYENIINAFIPPSSETENQSNKSNKSKNNFKYNRYDNTDLEQLKRDFDFFGYLQSRNGAYKNINKGVMFENCELCGHHDDLVYYKNTNSFYCFGRSGGTGGSIIDYIMSADSLNLAEAIDKFKYDLCGIPQKEKKSSSRKSKKSENKDGNQTADNQSSDDEPKAILTISELDTYLKNIGVSVKYNKITREVDITGADSKFSYEHLNNSLAIDTYDKLKLLYKKCNKSDVFDYIGHIATLYAYNPVLDMINAGKWDGQDRLLELFRIMRIESGDSLSQTLIYKWLWQCLSMARNEHGKYGAYGVLVLQGKQAVGKTTLARKFALKDDFFGEGLYLNFDDKDTIIRAGSCWIGELAEIETTFRGDKEKLKMFIGLPEDNYRSPYGRTKEKFSRRTSYVGTCNSEEFLIDETGNRRFWTIHIPERMDLEELENFNMLQLYLQVDEKVKHDVKGYRLTQNELEQLNERNSQHEKPLKSETEIRDIIYRAEKDNALFEDMTSTEFQQLYPALRNCTSNQIGIALKKIGVEQNYTRKDGKKAKLYMLPKPKTFNSSDF